jgi:hypothetical protein
MWRILLEFTLAAGLAALFVVLVLPFGAAKLLPATGVQLQTVGTTPDTRAGKDQISSNMNGKK